MKQFTIPIYEDRTDVTLSALLWEPSRELQGEKKRPAIVINPGGGYMMCSDRESDPVALKFAAMGYQTFVLRYTVFMKPGPRPAGPPAGGPPNFEDMRNPYAKYPQPLLDLGNAMLELRRHADEWYVDPDRVAVCGFSAGGHTAGLYAAVWDRPWLAERLGCTSEELRPAACILGYSVTDYANLAEQTGKGSMLDSMMKRGLFGTEDVDPALLLEASIPQQIGEHMPPTFLWHSYNDGLVPLQQSLDVLEALLRNKIPFETHIFEDGRHGISTADQSAADNKGTLNERIAQWPMLAGQWLQKRFALDLPDPPVFRGRPGGPGGSPANA